MIYFYKLFTFMYITLLIFTVNLFLAKNKDLFAFYKQSHYFTCYSYYEYAILSKEYEYGPTI